jgi:hypothetical protein
LLEKAVEFVLTSYILRALKTDFTLHLQVIEQTYVMLVENEQVLRSRLSSIDFRLQLIIKFSALVLLCAVRHLSCHHFRRVKTFAINNSRNNHHTQARSANTDQGFSSGGNQFSPVMYTYPMLV